jgi:hypothetical protein
MSMSKRAAVIIPRAVGLFLILYFGLPAHEENARSTAPAPASALESVEKVPFPAAPSFK